MFRNIGRFITYQSHKSPAHYNLTRFKENLTKATGQGRIDTASAIEHMHRVSTLVAKEKHKEAAQFIQQIEKQIGDASKEHHFEEEHPFR